MSGFFVYNCSVNDYLHPKRLKLYMEQIYKDFPILKSHPDYRFYYLYTNYPEQNEYLFVLTGTHQISNKLSEEINQSLHSYNDMFGFTSSSILTNDDMNNKIVKEFYKLTDTLRGSHFSVVLYEIW